MSSALFQPCAEGVLELVCGYPAPQQWRQPIVVLKAYIDDSLKDGYLVMAGYIASAESWAKFSVEWGVRLRQANITEFKMSQRTGVPPEMNGYFYRVIEEHTVAAICAAVSLADLNRVVDELGLPDILRNPYHICVKQIVSGCVQFQGDMEISEPIDFVFDEQDGVRKYVEEAWDYYLSTLPPDELVRTGSRPAWGKSHILMPLQAADIIAYWYRHRLNAGGTFDDRSSPFPWTVTRPLRGLALWFDDGMLRRTLEPLRDALLSIQRPGRQPLVTYTFNGRPLDTAEPF